jgi:hypothetical protein
MPAEALTVVASTNGTVSVLKKNSVVVDEAEMEFGTVREAAEMAPVIAALAAETLPFVAVMLPVVAVRPVPAVTVVPAEMAPVIAALAADAVPADTVPTTRFGVNVSLLSVRYMYYSWGRIIFERRPPA